MHRESSGRCTGVGSGVAIDNESFLQTTARGAGRTRAQVKAALGWNTRGLEPSKKRDKIRIKERRLCLSARL